MACRGRARFGRCPARHPLQQREPCAASSRTSGSPQGLDVPANHPGQSVTLISVRNSAMPVLDGSSFGRHCGMAGCASEGAADG